MKTNSVIALFLMVYGFAAAIAQTGVSPMTHDPTISSGFADPAAATSIPTITILSANTNPQITGATVTFTATVTPTTGSGIPTGSVGISVDGGAPTEVTLNGAGRALYSTSTLAAGEHVIAASYSGDSTYAPSNAGHLHEFILPATTGSSATKTTLTSSADPQVLGGAVTFTAAVAPVSGSAVPTGMIIGSVDGIPMVALALDGSGHASLTTTTLSVGAHTIAATYSGDATYAPSNATLTETITRNTSLQFIPTAPCRIADTRNPTGPFGGPELASGHTREFDIPQSACNIPNSAVAYSLNVTVVPNAALGYLTLWPSGQAQPNVSTLNSDGRLKANAAIVPAGANGGVSVFVTDPTQVILDIDGYFVPSGTGSALAFYPLTPCRIADTRSSTGPLGGPFLSGGSSRAFPVQSSSCNIPGDALAYSLNVTAVPHSKLDYLTIWPTGQTQPNVSTLNSSTGAITANAAIVPSGSNGDISVFVHDDADVILDVNGYFAAPATGGLSLYTVPPCRTLDTRSSSGGFNGTLAVSIQGSQCALPSTAQAYVLNATVVPSGELIYLSLWPDGSSQPLVSTLNALDGAITSNMAIVPTSNGSIDAFADGTSNLILDLTSYFAP